MCISTWCGILTAGTTKIHQLQTPTFPQGNQPPARHMGWWCQSHHLAVLGQMHRGRSQHTYHPWDCYIYLYEWLIFMVNVGKYTIHGWYGSHKLEVFATDLKSHFSFPSWKLYKSELICLLFQPFGCRPKPKTTSTQWTSVNSSSILWKKKLPTNLAQATTSWWFFTNPFEKYARQIGAFPRFGVTKTQRLVPIIPAHMGPTWPLQFTPFLRWTPNQPTTGLPDALKF